MCLEQVKTKMEQLIVPIAKRLRQSKGNPRTFCYHIALRNLEQAIASIQDNGEAAKTKANTGKQK